MAINILDAFEHQPQPIDYVLPGMVAGSVGAIVSPGGAGKSMAALQIGATLASGGCSDLLNLDLPALPGMGRSAWCTCLQKTQSQQSRTGCTTWANTWHPMSGSG